MAEAELEPQCGSDDRKEASEPKIRKLFAFSIVLNYSAALYLVAILSSATHIQKNINTPVDARGKAMHRLTDIKDGGNTGQMDRRLTFWGRGQFCLSVYS